jgi:hypothetical protein
MFPLVNQPRTRRPEANQLPILPIFLKSPPHLNLVRARAVDLRDVDVLDGTSTPETEMVLVPMAVTQTAIPRVVASLATGRLAIHPLEDTWVRTEYTLTAESPESRADHAT